MALVEQGSPSVEIALTRGRMALVDEVDAEWLSQWKWVAYPSPLVPGLWYVRRQYRAEGQRHTVFMHRVIMMAQPGQLVDHKDGDPLNNTRANLRFCTRGQNRRNSRRRIAAPTPYKGVYLRPENQVWRAIIHAFGKQYSLGTFATPEEAARAYDVAARHHFGEFANTNFPDQSTNTIGGA